MSKYFKQVKPIMVFDRDNRQINFERMPTGIGLIKLDDQTDANTIADLIVEAEARRNGVVRISAEIYESEKKKTSSRPSHRRLEFLGRLRVAGQPEPFKRKQAGVASAAVADKSASVENTVAPSLNSFLTRTRKMSELQIKPSDFST